MSNIGQTVVTPVARGVRYTQPAPMLFGHLGGSLRQEVPVTEIYLKPTPASIVGTFVGILIGAGINYVVFCQALKRCGR